MKIQLWRYSQFQLWYAKILEVVTVSLQDNAVQTENQWLLSDVSANWGCWVKCQPRVWGNSRSNKDLLTYSRSSCSHHWEENLKGSFEKKISRVRVWTAWDWVAAVFGASPYFCDLYPRSPPRVSQWLRSEEDCHPLKPLAIEGKKIIMIHLQRVLQSKDPFFVHSW